MPSVALLRANTGANSCKAAVVRCLLSSERDRCRDRLVMEPCALEAQECDTAGVCMHANQLRFLLSVVHPA